MCEDDEYESGAPSETADRKCDKVRQCKQLKEYERKAPTDTTDRDCQTISDKCFLQRSGKEGKYEVAAPTDTSDRVCAELTKCDGVSTYRTTVV